MNYIPVVFALDDNYAMPTAVAITSMIINKNYETCYKCYMITPGLSTYHYNKIKSLEQADCMIEIITNPSVLKGKSASLEKVTSTDYYRLMLDTLINEDKIIALDGDLLILDDLTELYNINLEENIIGGCYYRPHNIYHRKYVQETLKLDEGKRINIGVMLIDLKKIREKNLQPEFINNIGKFKVMSEDIINYVYKDKIKYIPLKYNYNLHFYKYKKLLKNDPIYSSKEYKSAEKNPAIFHYTLDKPWKVKGIPKSNLWYQYLKKSPYKDAKFSLKSNNYFFINDHNRIKINIFGIKLSISKNSQKFKVKN